MAPRPHGRHTRRRSSLPSGDSGAIVSGPDLRSSALLLTLLLVALRPARPPGQVVSERWPVLRTAGSDSLDRQPVVTSPNVPVCGRPDRLAGPDPFVGRDRVPSRDRRRGLPAGVRTGHPAQPDHLITNIRNLAGVPVDRLRHLRRRGLRGDVAERHRPGGQWEELISGGLTLAVLVMPIVIIITTEALRAVPRGIREAAYGVGATRWEVVRSHVLPYAAPASSRARSSRWRAHSARPRPSCWSEP